MRRLDDDSPTEDHLTPPDPRKVQAEKIGTPIRDAAVDPRPEDFLEPVNAGQANPHGPEVFNPGIHAYQGNRPVKGGEVHVDDTDVQAAAEKEHAQAAVSGELFTSDRPAGNASKADWKAYAVAQGADEDEAEAMSRDELREQYGA